MNPTRFLQLCILAWIAAATITVAVHLSRRRRAGAGLLLAYVANLTLLYWLGSLPYAVQGIYHGHEAAMFAAMPVSCLAVFGFAIGSVLVAPLVAGRSKLPHQPVAPSDDVHIAWIYLAVGSVFYALLSSKFGSIPSVTALLAGGENLSVAGVCLCCWTAWNRRYEASFWGWLALTLAFPLVSTLAQGMMGMGVSAVLLVFGFAVSFYRPRWRMMLVGVMLFYGGLAVYNGYMRDRNDIRRAVWGGASATDRMQSVVRTLTSLEPLDLHNDRLLYRVDERLNQNVFLGDAVRYMAQTGKSAHGATIRDALLAVVPRALWVDKPIRAGSGDIVSEFTGMTFAEGTSMGVGQVMELYINFGAAGVAIGFIFLGTVLTLIDWKAGEHLHSGQWRMFVFWFLLGTPLLVVGGAFAEVTGTMAGSIAIVWLVNHWLLPQRRRLARPIVERGALLAIQQARAE